MIATRNALPVAEMAQSFDVTGVYRYSPHTGLLLNRCINSAPSLSRDRAPSNLHERHVHHTGIPSPRRLLASTFGR